jgi:hypothetical protein
MYALIIDIQRARAVLVLEIPSSFAQGAISGSGGYYIVVGVSINCIILAITTRIMPHTHLYQAPSRTTQQHSALPWRSSKGFLVHLTVEICPWGSSGQPRRWEGPMPAKTQLWPRYGRFEHINYHRDRNVLLKARGNAGAPWRGCAHPAPRLHPQNWISAL